MVVPTVLVLIRPDPGTPTGLNGDPDPIALPPLDAVYHSIELVIV